MVTHPHSPQTDSVGKEVRPTDIQQDHAMSVPIERVDGYTLQVVQQLFPSPTNGLEFLALLLRWACLKQLSLDMEGNRDVAVIRVQSIRELAKLIGWAYETTHKYVLLFCALGLLVKLRASGKVELHFALGRYHPPLTLGALDRLIEQGRTKVRSCAKKVKRRYLLLYGEQSPTGLPAPKSPGCTIPELDEAIEAIKRLIARNGASRENLGAILLKLEHAQCRVAAEVDPASPPDDYLYGRLGVKRGDSVEQAPPLLPDNDRSNGRPGVTMGDSGSQREKGKGRPGTKTVDSKDRSQLASGRFLDVGVDSPKTVAPAPGRLSGETVDSHPAFPNENGRLASQQPTVFSVSDTPNGRFTPKTVDSPTDSPAQRVDSAAAETSNVNVLTFFAKINVNVNVVAKFCCLAFGEPASKQGIYRRLFETTGFGAQTIAAAFVHTMIHRQDGTMRNPAAVFIQCCKRYHQQGVPEEAAVLLERYGQLSYTQLLERSCVPVPSASSVSKPLSKKYPGGHIPAASASLPHIPLLSAHILLRDRGGMVGEIACRLHAQIAHDRRLGLCRTGLVRLSDGTYAVLVDNTVARTVRQAAFYSVEEWQMRAATLVRCMDLFPQEGEPIRPSQLLLAQKREEQR